MVEVCEEMQKLRNWLDDNDIAWQDKSDDFNGAIEDFWICRTHFNHEGQFFSVINGFGTYGGTSYLRGGNKGLLEVAAGEDIIGYLTAEDVIKMIEGDTDGTVD